MAVENVYATCVDDYMLLREVFLLIKVTVLTSENGNWRRYCHLFLSNLDNLGFSRWVSDGCI